MFGKRPDGRLVKNMDPLVKMTAYIMPTRVDSQVYMDYNLPYENLVNYISKKAIEGYKITFMELILAAFVRATSQNPEINRFIMNKKLYSRNELCCSITILKDTPDESIEESVVKVKFDPKDTIFDVSARVKSEILENKKEEVSNGTLKAIDFLMKIPGLPNLVIAGSRLLDRYGILPKVLIDILPFHTSLFFTNMASIGMERVYHHIYNYGTTSLFISIGNVKRSLKLMRDGSVKRERLLPMGITADERICAGASYAKFFTSMKKLLENPELLEVEPENIVYDKNCEYSQPKPDHSCIKIER